jgi:hypothetical protein
MFIHTVFFWCKPGTQRAAVDHLVEDCQGYLARVETVRHLWCGRPAMTPRDVVDNSYSAALTVVFDDRAGHDVYQDHPLHKEFIQRNKEHWERVQVFDYE